jgi:ElaB/YqjD/DUF883 family membrane-anchored ribosome-binding protein
MSEASKDLEAKTGGGVPTSDETIAATVREVAETAQSARGAIEDRMRQDPLRAVFVAAAVGLLAAILAKRL